MREEYDFTNARKNPFAKKKKQITINIDASTIEYFNNKLRNLTSFSLCPHRYLMQYFSQQ